MKNIVLFDDEFREQLLPLSYTRPCSLLRVGILTISEKWAKFSELNISYQTTEYLSFKYAYKGNNESIYINGRILPNADLWNSILQLNSNQKLVKNGITIAYNTENSVDIEYAQDISIINHPDDIFSNNAQAIIDDIILLKPSKMESKLSVNIIGEHPVYAENNVWIENASLNTTDGPIYLGKNSIVMEGSLIRGPFALCSNSQVKMGAKIYSGTTIGPWCKVGGEVNNVVFMGFSNKGHDGFLGNSVIGEWCNLGADSNNSNLKNNYDQVRIWDYTLGSFRKTGKQFCGLIMGDHSKCGINTMFNTGTVVGVSANIFGSGFPRNFIPSFSWGGASGFSTYMLKKALTTSELVLKRRNIDLTQEDIDIMSHIFNLTSKYRNDK